MAYLQMKITPKLAEKMLEKNSHNRPLRDHHIEHLAAVMLAGDWRLTGEPIKFYKKWDDPNSVLLDGQHRLAALIIVGKPFNMEIIDELPANTFEYMDQGRKRSAPDVLSIEGYKNVNVVAGIAKMLILYNRGGIKNAYLADSSKGAGRVSPHEILQFVRENEAAVYQAIDGVKEVAIISKMLSVHGACYFLFRKRSVDDCEKFFYQLAEGIKLSKTSPVYHLRQLYIDHLHSRAKNFLRRDFFIMEILAWNWFRDRKQIAGRKLLTNFTIDTLPKTIK